MSSQPKPPNGSSAPNSAAPPPTQKTTPHPAGAPGGQTPHEFFEGLFEVLSAELAENPAFAARLAARLEGVVRVAAAPPPRGAKTPPPEALMAADLRQEREARGEADLRAWLGGFKNAELAAFIRARKLSDGALSKRPKNSLLNIILRAAR